MLKNKYLIFLIIVLAFSCDFIKKNKKSYFSGKIIKKTNDKISLLKDQVILKESYVSKEGIFYMSLDSIKDGLYNFKHLPEFQYLIIENGDSLVLRLNAVDFDESLVFTGIGSPKNNYLIDIFLNHENEERFIKSLMMKKPLPFRKSIDSLLDLKISKFKKFKKNNKLNYTSIMIMEHAIKLPLYSNIEAYISGIKQNNVIKNINNNFYDYRDEIDFNIQELSNFKPYLDYIILRTNNQSGIDLNSLSNLYLQFNLDRINFVNSSISNPVIKSQILRYIAFEYLLKENILINIDTFLYEFLKISVNKKNNIEIKQLYENISLLQKGNHIPEIELITVIKENIFINNIYSNKPVIYVFWSYDQNSHQIGLFNKINEFLNTNKKYNFHCININSDVEKWREYLGFIQKNKNIKHFIANDFSIMSKKMVLNNLNKIIITDSKGKIRSISNISSLKSFYLGD